MVSVITRRFATTNAGFGSEQLPQFSGRGTQGSDNIRAYALDPAAADGLLISDFWGVFLAPVRASLSADELTIDRQEPDADAYFVQGSGVVQDEPGSLSFDYRVSDENDPTAIVTDRCQSTWTKQ